MTRLVARMTFFPERRVLLFSMTWNCSAVPATIWMTTGGCQRTGGLPRYWLFGDGACLSLRRFPVVDLIWFTGAVVPCFMLDDCRRVASAVRIMLMALSSVTLAPSSKSLRRTSSSETPKTVWPNRRVFWQAAQKSFSNSHLRAISRRSPSQFSTDSESRWMREANCWRQTWQFRPALHRSCSFLMMTSASTKSVADIPIVNTAFSVAFQNQDRRMFAMYSERSPWGSAVLMVERERILVSQDGGGEWQTRESRWKRMN